MKNKRLMATILVLMLCLSLSAPALADNGVNPFSLLDNFKALALKIVGALGIILLVFALVNFGLAWKEQDPGRKAQAVNQIFGGVIVAGAGFILDALVNGTLG